MHMHLHCLSKYAKYKTVNMTPKFFLMLTTASFLIGEGIYNHNNINNSDYLTKNYDITYT